MYNKPINLNNSKWDKLYTAKSNIFHLNGQFSIQPVSETDSSRIHYAQQTSLSKCPHLCAKLHMKLHISTFYYLILLREHLEYMQNSIAGYKFYSI